MNNYKNLVSYVMLLCALCIVNVSLAQAPPGYLDRFLELRDEFYDPANGYFSAEGSPHHSIETLIVEAPDYGHVSTSELYSYWMWLEVMYGRITGDWTPLNEVWDKTEQFIIPTAADQPTNSFYNPSSPATYASEFPLPNAYPSPLDFGVPVGSDPVSAELASAYGSDIYQMHWLIDNDNFYGYGSRGDGVTAPSYINTFQRGEQESVFETIPHPSWEDFSWGGTNGFLPLFIDDQSYSSQWRYTSAPDADARAVQAMYWATEYAKEQGTSLNVLDLDKATKMGDYLRIAMFDKYFKPLGVESASGPGASGRESAHYLMSWYMSWGGAVNSSAGWAYRIGSSHCHFGYQNPVAAYALAQVDELKPQTPTGVSDWTESLQRQLEFYTWLQSREGGIAGGATNSWNGNYSAYPAGKSTFYGMAYTSDPVYKDPGSGTWFGWQAWSMERIAEYYYITNDPMAKNLMDNWAGWVKDVVRLVGDDDFEIPATLEWSGEPDSWNPASPGSNANLSVTVVNYGKDLGVAASMAKALTYYAAATRRYETLDVESRDLAKEILDRMWITYRDDKGVASLESRGDFTRIFEQEVYVPQGFSGQMANGDVIEPGVSFLDIRSGYRNDPEFARLEAAYNSGEDFTQTYHRSWAQIEVALANADYGFFFGDSTFNQKPTVSITSPADGTRFQVVPADISIAATASDADGAVASVEFFQNGVSVGVDATAPYSVTFANAATGTYELTAIATDDEGATGSSEVVTVFVGNAPPVASFTASPSSGASPLVVSFDASASSDPDGDALTFSWDFGDGTSGTGETTQHTYNNEGSYTAILTITDGNGASNTESTTIEVISLDCNLLSRYGVPLAAGLPTVNNSSYNNIYVLGTGGPNLSNVINLTINWANESWGSGLWQFSVQTNNGSPGYFIDLRSVSTNNFASASPGITFSGSGFSGLDGSYYVNTDGGNFVLVAESGAYAIYCSNSSTAPDDCAALTFSTIANSARQLTDDVRVYPNPASGAFFMNIKEANAIDGISLINISGQEVKVFDSSVLKNGKVTFGETLNEGVYFLKVLKEGAIETLTLIKN